MPTLTLCSRSPDLHMQDDERSHNLLAAGVIALLSSRKIQETVFWEDFPNRRSHRTRSRQVAGGPSRVIARTNPELLTRWEGSSLPPAEIWEISPSEMLTPLQSTLRQPQGAASSAHMPEWKPQKGKASPQILPGGLLDRRPAASLTAGTALSFLQHLAAPAQAAARCSTWFSLFPFSPRASRRPTQGTQVPCRMAAALDPGRAESHSCYRGEGSAGLNPGPCSACQRLKRTCAQD